MTCIVVYNAFPALSSAAAAYRQALRAFAPGGTLTVAHG